MTRRLVNKTLNSLSRPQGFQLGLSGNLSAVNISLFFVCFLGGWGGEETPSEPPAAWSMETGSPSSDSISVIRPAVRAPTEAACDLTVALFGIARCHLPNYTTVWGRVGHLVIQCSLRRVHVSCRTLKKLLNFFTCVITRVCLCITMDNIDRFCCLEDFWLFFLFSETIFRANTVPCHETGSQVDTNLVRIDYNRK